MRVVLTGPPGAGKGTQAKRLTERCNMVHLSSGDIFRAERATGSSLGEQLTAYMDTGRLVPDEIVVAVMAKAIAAQPAEAGLLLDGFPRTVPQAEALDEQLARLDRPLDAVLVIDVPDGPLLERITGRRSCPECGRVYHLMNLRPAEDDRCDRCKVPLVQRTDDTEAVVRQRLRAYRRQTAAMLEHYVAAGRKVISVDGSEPPDKVTERIAAALAACD